MSERSERHLSESDVHARSGQESADFEPDPAYDAASRARVYSIVALVCAALTIWYLFHNVFLAPAFGIAGAFCSWRGIKNGGYTPALIVLLLICLIPALLAIVALLLLVPNLPDLSFSHVRIVKG